MTLEICCKCVHGGIQSICHATTNFARKDIESMDTPGEKNTAMDSGPWVRWPKAEISPEKSGEVRYTMNPRSKATLVLLMLQASMMPVASVIIEARLGRPDNNLLSIHIYI